MGLFKKQEKKPDPRPTEVRLPQGHVAVRDDKLVLRAGEVCRRTDVLYRFWTITHHRVPRVTPEVFVSWYLPDDNESILRFHREVPRHDKPVFGSYKEFISNGQPVPVASGWTYEQRKCILDRVADALAANPAADFREIYQDLGVVVMVVPSPYPTAIRWNVAELRMDETIEMLFDKNLVEDSFTYLIDTIRHVHIESDLGPEASITWKYDAAKVLAAFKDKRFAKPDLQESRQEHQQYYGDVPEGVDRAFRRLAGEICEEYHTWTDKKLSKPTYCHYPFEESWVWGKEKSFPIKILTVEFNDRRPKPPEPSTVIAEDAIQLGMGYPPPDPEDVKKKLDRYSTPYWEYPKAKAPTPAFIPYSSRQTIHIMGQPDMGKSTLMRSMFRQDVMSGKGVTLIDPHGDLANQALRSIPRSRWDDVIYFDPIRCPIGIDFLKYDNEFERDVVADDLFALFKHLTEGKGEAARLDAILKNAFPLLLRTPGATFLDLYRLVTDNTFRETAAKKITDDLLRDFWLVQYPKFPGVAAEPLISRMQRFQANQALRTMFGTTSDLDLYDVIRQRKILICNISAEYLRGETKDIIGALLTMKLHLAALKQAGLPENKRALHYLYVDEFHTFRSSSFQEIITGDRKFGLRPTLANQYLDQLSSENYEAVRGAGFRVYFRLQDDDAPRLGRAVGGFTGNDLLNLDKGEAILRPGKPSDTVKVKLPPPQEDDEDATEYVIARTRENYPSRKVVPRDDQRLDHDPEPGEWPTA
jgi:hypothetical protein